MQVISGKYKNRVLEFPSDIRPTTQKHKKIVFDVLRNDIQDTKVLDLYSGSGQLGIESLSLGAQHITFVDISRYNVQLIKRNLDKLSIPESQYQIVCSDISSFLNRNQTTYDLILCDPPYHEVKWSDLSKLNLCGHETSILVVKYSPHNPPSNFANWQLVKTKDQKDTIIAFYVYSQTDNQ